jgi:hypothetical protein
LFLLALVWIVLYETYIHSLPSEHQPPQVIEGTKCIYWRNTGDWNGWDNPATKRLPPVNSDII